MNKIVAYIGMIICFGLVPVNIFLAIHNNNPFSLFAMVISFISGMNILRDIHYWGE